MYDGEPVIRLELDRLTAGVWPEPDWADVTTRSGSTNRLGAGGWRGGRLVVVAAVVGVGLVVAAVALAATFGDFSRWLTGQPGSPAPAAQQRAFERATRSWQGFPRDAQLRRLITTTVAGARYTLYGFRGGGSLCLRLNVTGTVVATEAGCVPLGQLRADRVPAVVVASDSAIGAKHTIARRGPFQVVETKASVSFGVVADGVSRVTVVHRRPAATRTTVAGDAFLSVSPRLSPFNATTRITASHGVASARVPFVVTSPFESGGETQPAAQGPTTVQRAIHGGTIRWFAHREPLGQPVPTSIHHTIGGSPKALFARMITPDPAVPERIIVSISPAGKRFFGGRLKDNRQVCAELIGGPYGYGGGDCWPADRLFTTAPFTAGVSGQTGGQTVALAGLASDDVARLTLFTATRRVQPIPIHDNTFFVAASLAEAPLRLVAYDHNGKRIGITTYNPPGYHAPVRITPYSHWRQVLANSAGRVYSAPSPHGGTCIAFSLADGSAMVGCDRHLQPSALALSLYPLGKTSILDGQTGRAITKVIAVFASGNELTLTPKHGIVLAKLSSATGRLHLIGVNAQGKRIAHQQLVRSS
jgi:hypothetical protein